MVAMSFMELLIYTAVVAGAGAFIPVGIWFFYFRRK